ncbi:MAG: acetylxylan esterase [Microscillaceae bacterium]|nr:acetylxylan esterase [Microscillaceae bacterium]MDW8460584.1 acetylxylan esterase [Cytophagales bacterium]
MIFFVKKNIFLAKICAVLGILFTNQAFQAILFTSNIDLSFTFEQDKGIIEGNEPIIIHFRINNKSTRKIHLQTYCSWLQMDKNKLLSIVPNHFSIEPNTERLLSVSYQPQEKGFYKANLSVKQAGAWVKSIEVFFGYNLSTYKPYPPKPLPADFEAFWQSVKQSLAAVAPNFRLERKQQLCTESYEVFLLEMQSLDNQTIRGFYRMPIGKRKVPAILQLPSLGGAFYNIGTLEQKPKHGVPLEYALLSLNVRGHGNSKDTFDADKLGNDFFTIGIGNKHTYIYKGIIADCLRAIDFLHTRPEIDKQKIIVEGGSQGGGLSLIVAGLDNRIRYCCPDVPFLCNMPQLSEVFWVKEVLQKKQFLYSTKQMLETLNYFDAQFFAQKIRIPVYMSIGLQDYTCPPHTAWEAYWQIPSAEKQISIYPYGRHAGGGEQHRKAKFAWLAAQLQKL